MEDADQVLHLGIADWQPEPERCEEEEADYLRADAKEFSEDEKKLFQLCWLTSQIIQMSSSKFKRHGKEEGQMSHNCDKQDYKYHSYKKT